VNLDDFGNSLCQNLSIKLMVKPKAKQNKHVEINRRQKKIITLKLVQCMARF
jgi:hypothetical protein